MNDVKLLRDALAQRFGLPEKYEALDGTYQGAPLRIEASLFRFRQNDAMFQLDLQSGQIQQVQTFTELRMSVSLRFRPKLDAGLQVDPLGSFAMLTGRTGFQSRFRLGGMEADRIDALFPEAAREAIDKAFLFDPGPRVRDVGISLDLRRMPPYPSIDELAAAIEPLPAVWHAVLEGSRKLRPPSGAEEAVVHLAGLSLPEGLEIRGCPAGIAGEVDGISVAVSVGAARQGFWPVKVQLGLRRPIPGGPQVMREDRFGLVDRIGAMLSGRPEIVLGDRKFDQRFAVRSLKPAELKEVLSAEVREAMLALDAVVPVSLAASWIEGNTRMKNAADLAKVGTHAIALARAIGRSSAAIEDRR